MTNTNPKYTTLRGNVFWLHFKLPAAIYRRSNLMSPLIRTSLSTDKATKAGSMAQILVLKLREFCEAVSDSEVTKESLNKVITDTLRTLGVVQAKPSEKAEAVKAKPNTVQSAYQQFTTEMLASNMWRQKSEIDNKASLAIMIELMGDIPLAKLDGAYCREYKSKLILYPLHRTKLKAYKGIPVNKLIDSGAVISTISITTANNQMKNVNSYFNWLVKQELIATNPLSGMRIKQKTSAKAARSPFDQEDITSLFSSPLYREHKFKHDYEYWLPLLGLFTGARLEELCQLYLVDINLNSAIPYFNIDDAFEGQHLKNDSSRRTIPIHPELLELGFAEFVEQKQQQGESKLFGYLVPQRQKLGHMPSKWFSRYKTKQGIDDKKKVFHSFRHTMVDNLKLIRAQGYEITALLGHKSGSITYDIYGAEDTPLDSIHDMLQGLSFTHLLHSVKPWK